MKTFKVYWANGETSLVMGKDIADALSLAFNGDRIVLTAISNWTEVSFPTEDGIDTERFSCTNCKGPMTVNDTPYVVFNSGKGKMGHKYSCTCQDCKAFCVINEFDNEVDAIQDWNRRQLELHKSFINTSTELYVTHDD